MDGVKRSAHTLVLATIAVGVICTAWPSFQCAAAEPAARVRVFEPPESVEGPSRTGFVPPPGDFSHLKTRVPRSLAPLPSRFDWRDTSGVITEVGDQGNCGACYAFAAVSNLESAILIKGGPLYDFSVNNVKECDWWAENTTLGSCNGGNASMVASFLSQKGTVLEPCDPFVAQNRTCKQGCPYFITTTGWLQISADEVAPTEVLKDYVYNYGPMFVAMIAANGLGWPTEFSTYDGSYTLYYDGPGSLDHAVLIVGWDDTLSYAGGQGAWIVKNSWGEDWGEDGFFYIAYGSARIGCYASTFYGWQPYDPDGIVFFHDDAGFMGTTLGFESPTAWAFSKFVAEEPVRLERVEFWTTDATTDVDVYIYDGIVEGTLMGELASELDNVIDEYGYHSIELSNPVDISATNDFYVVVKITNASYAYPIALDNYGPPEPGFCFVSPNGTAWTDVRNIPDCSICAQSDVCVRVRATSLSTSSVRRVPDDYATIGEAIEASDPGDTVIVGPGTYPEGPLVLTKDIVLMSEAGPESTVVDAGGSLKAPAGYASVLSLDGVTGGCRVIGLAFKGAETTGAGGGIVITNSAPSIVDCVVYDNSAAAGAGIMVQESSPFIRNCTVADNSGLAGIYLDSSSSGLVSKCIVSGTEGGPGILSGSLSTTVECCDIFGNLGTIAGGTDGGGNFFENPMYCGRVDGNFLLQSISPCILGYECGRVGALGEGCGSQIPEMPAYFLSMPGDASTKLTWVLPGEPVEGAFIVYKTAGYPQSPGDGTPVENGMYGYFPGEPASADSFYHTGLTNGVTYYYAAYSYNRDWKSYSGLLDSATPVDVITPGKVKYFSAQSGPSGGNSISLSWTCPDDADFKGVLVKYSTEYYPSLPSDGSPVENGSDGVFLGQPGSDTVFVHTGLTPGLTYMYSAFSFDDAPTPNYSDAAYTSGTPGIDDTPPGEVRSFAATTGDSKVTLTWLNPSAQDFVETILRYSTSAYPVSPEEGLPVDNGTGGIFPAAPASADTFIQTGLENGVMYYYSAFTADTIPNYSEGAFVSAMPLDETPPVLAISVLRNPYLGNYLDVYVLASETLLLDSLIVTVGDDEIGMSEVDAAEHVYIGDYDLYSIGVITIKARARDLAMNPGSAERQFASSFLAAGEGGTVGSVDGRFALYVPPGAAARDAYVLVWEADASTDGCVGSYEVSPGSFYPGDYMRVEFAYDDAAEEPEHLAVQIGGGERAVRLDSYVDAASHRIVAYSREMGVFSLVRDRDAVTPPAGREGLAILYNSPNPFENSTEIAYQVPVGGDLSIDIIGIDGRLVKAIHRGYVTAGRHSIGWDGRDETGRRVASGVYFVRAISPDGIASRKVAVLR